MLSCYVFSIANCEFLNNQETGEGGIRTLGSLLGYGALAKRCFQPLSHLTKICRHRSRHLPSLCGFGMASRRVATDSSREYREELPIANCRLPTDGLISVVLQRTFLTFRSHADQLTSNAGTS